MGHHRLLSIALLLWHSVVGATSGEEAPALPQSGDKRCLIQLNSARRPVGSKADEERQAREREVSQPEDSFSPRWPNPDLDFGEPISSPVARPAVHKKAHRNVPRSLTAEADSDALARIGTNIDAQRLAVNSKRFNKEAHGKMRRSLTSEADRDAHYRVGSNEEARTLGVGSERFNNNALERMRRSWTSEADGGELVRDGPNIEAQTLAVGDERSETELQSEVLRSLTSEAVKDALSRARPDIQAQTLAVGNQRYGSLSPEVAEETLTETADRRYRRSSLQQANEEVSFDPMPTPMSEAASSHRRYSLQQADTDVLYNSVPAPMLEAGVTKRSSQSTNEDETFFNHLPRLHHPMQVSSTASAGSSWAHHGEADSSLALAEANPMATGFEELRGSARTSKDMFRSWEPTATATLGLVADKAPRNSLLQVDEQEQFFNPVPSPIAPMLPEDARAIFGPEASLLYSNPHSRISTADDFRALEEASFLRSSANSQTFPADDFRGLQKKALPAKDPDLLASIMFMEEAQKRNTAIYHPKVPVEPNQSGLLASSPAEADGADRLWKSPLQQQADTTASMLERLWSHVSGAVQHTHSKFIEFAYMVPAPGLFLLAGAALTSVVTVLTVGRITRKTEAANPQALAANPRSMNQDFGDVFVRLPSPGSPSCPSHLQPQPGQDPNTRPEDLDPSSPFAEALAHRALPPVHESTLDSNDGSTLAKFRRNHTDDLRGVPMRPSVAKSVSFGNPPDQGTPHMKALTAAHYLCAGLVVPPDSECIFAVPSIKESKKYVVFDLTGQPALQLEVRMPDWKGSSGLDPKPVVILHTCERREEHGKVEASKVLAFCKMEHCTSGKNDQDRQQDRAYIYDAGGVLFGTLSAWAVHNQCYTLTSTRSSIQLSLEGNFDEHMVNIWSDSRHLVGDSCPSCNVSSEQASDYWRMRVLANMDAGLLLTSLVCAELIEGKHRHRNSSPKIQQNDRHHAYEAL